MRKKQNGRVKRLYLEVWNLEAFVVHTFRPIGTTQYLLMQEAHRLYNTALVSANEAAQHCIPTRYESKGICYQQMRGFTKNARKALHEYSKSNRSGWLWTRERDPILSGVGLHRLRLPLKTLGSLQLSIVNQV